MAPLPRYLGVSRHIRSFRELSPDTETLQPDTGDMSATVSLCRTPLILSIVMVMRGACSAPAWCLGGISPAANDQHDHRPSCMNLCNSSSIYLGNREAKSGVSWDWRMRRIVTYSHSLAHLVILTTLIYESRRWG